MIEAWIAKLGMDAALGFIKAYWKPLAIGLAVLIIAAAAVLWYRHYQHVLAEAAQAERDRDAAVHTAITNADVIDKLTRDEAAARAATNKTVAADQVNTAAHAAVKKDLEHVPNDAAGLYFDDLGDRLRVIDQAASPH